MAAGLSCKTNTLELAPDLGSLHVIVLGPNQGRPGIIPWLQSRQSACNLMVLLRSVQVVFTGSSRFSRSKIS